LSKHPSAAHRPSRPKGSSHGEGCRHYRVGTVRHHEDGRHDLEQHKLRVTSERRLFRHATMASIKVGTCRKREGIVAGQPRTQYGDPCFGRVSQQHVFPVVAGAVYSGQLIDSESEKRCQESRPRQMRDAATPPRSRRTLRHHINKQGARYLL